MKHSYLTGSVATMLFLLTSVAYSQGRPAEAETRRVEVKVEAKAETETEAKAKAKAKAKAEARNHSEEARAEHAPDEHAAGGLSTAGEMHERRDQAKAVKEDYRESREPGQEGADPDGDKKSVAEEQKSKAKKPWWKLWGD